MDVDARHATVTAQLQRVGRTGPDRGTDQRVGDRLAAIAVVTEDRGVQPRRPAARGAARPQLDPRLGRSLPVDPGEHERRGRPQCLTDTVQVPDPLREDRSSGSPIRVAHLQLT
jgi:hypothetical protein